jgi:formylglycine-generating enzyme required for sulfatase activity
MVWVPGGPVPLDGPVAKDFLRDYGPVGADGTPGGAPVACTPGFWMAVQPVTNGEYRRWLAGEIVRRLPDGWTPGELQTASLRREDRPAVGMLAADADFFASSRRSRLPTEVEWRRAAYCRDTSWVEEMNADWDRAGRQVALLFEQQQRRVAELMAMADEATRQRLAAGSNGPTEYVRTKAGSVLPRMGSRPRQLEVRSNSRTGIVLAPTPELIEDGLSIQEFTQDFLKGEWRWGQVTPVDAFRQDKSIFGVRNVLINAPEYVQGSTQQIQFAPKRFPAHVDADLSQFYWGEHSSLKPDHIGVGGSYYTKTGKIDWLEEIRVRTDDTQQLASAELVRRMLLSAFTIRYWRGGEATWSGVVSVVGDTTLSSRTYNQGDPIETQPDRTNLSYKTVSIRAGFRTDIRPGFRIAR